MASNDDWVDLGSEAAKTSADGNVAAGDPIKIRATFEEVSPDFNIFAEKPQEALGSAHADSKEYLMTLRAETDTAELPFVKSVSEEEVLLT